MKKGEGIIDTVPDLFSGKGSEGGGTDKFASRDEWLGRISRLLLAARGQLVESPSSSH